jgi:hypothetical protein
VRHRFVPHQLRLAQALELAHEGVPFNSSNANSDTATSA